MENMTKVQLQEVCTQKGIKFTSKMSKQDLIALLKAEKSSEPKAKKGTEFKGEY